MLSSDAKKDLHENWIEFTLFFNHVFTLGYNFVRVVAGYVSPISVVMPSKLLSAVIVGLAPKLFGNSAYLFSTDFQLIANQGLDFAILPIGMH